MATSREDVGKFRLRLDSVKGVHGRDRENQYHECISPKEYLGDYPSVKLDATHGEKETIAEEKINSRGSSAVMR